MAEDPYVDVQLLITFKVDGVTMHSVVMVQMRQSIVEAGREGRVKMTGFEVVYE